MRPFISRPGVGIPVLIWLLMTSTLCAPLPGASADKPLNASFHSNLGTKSSGGEGHMPEAMVVVTESIGTAWPIASGYLVTNNHVVSDAESITLIDQNGRGFNAWPVLLDELHDLAFLEVTDMQDLPPALPLAGYRMALDTRVFTVGFPNEAISSREPNRSQGRICGLNGSGKDDASYRTTVPVRHGNSGGPLMSLTGEVVGVIKSMLAYRDTVSEHTYVLENASCAVKIDALKDLLKWLPRKSQTLRTVSEPTGSKAALYDTVAHSVLRVVARHYEYAPVD